MVLRRPAPGLAPRAARQRPLLRVRRPAAAHRWAVPLGCLVPPGRPRCPRPGCSSLECHYHRVPPARVPPGRGPAEPPAGLPRPARWSAWGARPRRGAQPARSGRPAQPGPPGQSAQPGHRVLTSLRGRMGRAAPEDWSGGPGPRPRGTRSRGWRAPAGRSLGCRSRCPTAPTAGGRRPRSHWCPSARPWPVRRRRVRRRRVRTGPGRGRVGRRAPGQRRAGERPAREGRPGIADGAAPGCSCIDPARPCRSRHAASAPACAAAPAGRPRAPRPAGRPWPAGAGGGHR
jgi:hypothetical protein